MSSQPFTTCAGVTSRPGSALTSLAKPSIFGSGPFAQSTRTWIQTQVFFSGPSSLLEPVAFPRLWRHIRARLWRLRSSR
jgi:hypothetical protein